MCGGVGVTTPSRQLALRKGERNFGDLYAELLWLARDAPVLGTDIETPRLMLLSVAKES